MSYLKFYYAPFLTAFIIVIGIKELFPYSIDINSIVSCLGAALMFSFFGSIHRRLFPILFSTTLTIQALYGVYTTSASLFPQETFLVIVLPILLITGFNLVAYFLFSTSEEYEVF